MRGVFIVVAFLHAPTGEPVKNPISWRFRGVSLSECVTLLGAEKEYNTGFIVQGDGSDQSFHKTIVHRWRKMQRILRRRTRDVFSSRRRPSSASPVRPGERRDGS